MGEKLSFLRFKSMAEHGNLIPVYQEFLADTETPVSAYLKIRDRPSSYLLESAEGGKSWGRYSFIGFDPFLNVVSRNGKIEILREDGETTIQDGGNPLLVLRDIGRSFKPVGMEDFSPFQGGLVGYCNYEVVRNWEDLPGLSPSGREYPECYFTASSRLIIFDHLTHTIRLVAFAHIHQGKGLAEAYDEASIKVDEIVELLQAPLAPAPPEKRFSLSDIRPNISKEEFKKVVRRAKEYIVSGDVIQVVLSQRLSGELSGDDFVLYRNLRSINPSPYMFYLNFGDIRLIGASPEVLVRLTGEKIELKPIAGTRPRGEDSKADEALEKELMSDPKERAEHIMLVDLGRNDVGRVAIAGSVKVPRLMVVERYSHVMHIVSDVEGVLKPEADGIDLFMSAFPAGTVTGAPKIRAMEIVNELETEPRGPYAGAVGYFGFNGNMDFCITIRTITLSGNRLSIQVGAGIVADSSPEAEYDETLRKAGAMLKTIEEAKGYDSNNR